MFVMLEDKPYQSYHNIRLSFSIHTLWINVCEDITRLQFAKYIILVVYHCVHIKLIT